MSVSKLRGSKRKVSYTEVENGAIDGVEVKIGEPFGGAGLPGDSRGCGLGVGFGVGFGVSGGFGRFGVGGGVFVRSIVDARALGSERGCVVDLDVLEIDGGAFRHLEGGVEGSSRLRATRVTLEAWPWRLRSLAGVQHVIVLR